uniref:Uncharacterized protein n=1 Tax=Oryza meridionalis TaxID=40149 RepID=A0A0E0CCT3_9ORYZ
MSLVAYDASSDEEDAGGEPPAAAAASPTPVPSSFGPQPRPPSPSTSVGAAPQPPPHSQNISSTSSSNISLPAPSLDLPNVADLFSSPSRGSTSMMDSTSRKRESNGSAFQDPRSKFPRVQSGQSGGARIASGNTLVPPQLSGRSNVVTEDMTKLFVARRKE